MGLEEPKLPAHQFMAAMGEWERGAMTRAQVIKAFDLSAAEQGELDDLAAVVKPPTEAISLGGRVTMTNVGATFDANLDSRSLPFFHMQKAGVNRIEVELLVRKVGTGTQDWQLWNDTDGVAVIGPAGANVTTGSLQDTDPAGDHTLSAGRVLANPMPPGHAKVRLRCRSTVAADDPVLLQGSVVLFRPANVNSLTLHEVLLLAERGIDPYTSVAAVKNRLGVP